MHAARRVNKESHHASIPSSRRPPPRPIHPARRLVPSQLWLNLTAESRARILRTLSRIVAQQLAVPPIIQEATHEHD
jgi:hypothetical protein